MNNFGLKGLKSWIWMNICYYQDRCWLSIVTERKLNIIFIFNISMSVFTNTVWFKKNKQKKTTTFSYILLLLCYSTAWSISVVDQHDCCCLFTDQQVCSHLPLTNSLTLLSCELLLLYKHSSWKHKHEHLLVCFHRVFQMTPEGPD